MHIEFLVEEPSAEATLSNLVPKILGQDFSFKVHSYQGKPDLLNKLLPRLRGYKTWMPEDWRIVVLIDADEEDCRALKDNLEGIAQRAGLFTKSNRTIGSYFQVLNRLAIEELEAWFFGDVEAVHSSYPRISLNLGKKAKYRNPDTIRGGHGKPSSGNLRKWDISLLESPKSWLHERYQCIWNQNVTDPEVFKYFGKVY